MLTKINLIFEYLTCILHYVNILMNKFTNMKIFSNYVQI
jgi:hypothetical protein